MARDIPTRSSLPPQGDLSHTLAEQDEDYDVLIPEEEVLEGDFTLRAVLVGLLVGCVEFLLCPYRRS